MGRRWGRDPPGVYAALKPTEVRDELGPRAAPGAKSALPLIGKSPNSRACPYQFVIFGRAISNFVCHHQAQRCIVSNALLAKERHCIDLGTGIVVGANGPDVLALAAIGRRSGYVVDWLFTLPTFRRSIHSCDVAAAAMQPTVAQYQDAPRPARLSHSRIVPEVHRPVTTVK
jgi:hypothetical protein